MSKLTDFSTSPKANDNLINVIPNLKTLIKLNLSSGNLVNLDLISTLVKLESLSISRNKINNINAIKNLPNLRYINLEFNKLTNISALASNSGITGDKDTVKISSNCLDISASSQSLEDINILKDRAVKVTYEPQKTCN